MRPFLALSLGLFLVPAPGAEAGVPGPGGPCGDLLRSSVGLSGQSQSCQYRFRVDGGLDALGVNITLRDPFDVPIGNCETSVTIASTSGSFCGCEPTALTAFTEPDGTLSVFFSRLGGRGELAVKVTAHCCAGIQVASIPVVFSTPDLDGSCESAPAVSTTVTDLALWASALPPGPYALASDYDCSGAIGLLDLGIWAGGLALGCAP